jgi:hypothetical protein
MIRILWPECFKRRTQVLGLVLLLVTIIGLVLLGRHPGIRTSATPKVFDILPTKAQILAEVESESIDQTIEGLPTLLDQFLASTAPGVGLPCPEKYEWAKVVTPRLTRVRKLLAQIDERQRAHYTAVFLKKIDWCMDGFAKSWKEHLDATESLTILDEPTLYMKKRDTATALVYILAEWGRLEALPTFTKLLDQPDPLPINRLLLLYSTHLLIESMPMSGFSQAKFSALAAYKRLTHKLFPEVEWAEVPAWNAKYEETDFRAVFLREPVPISSQQMIRLRIYPDIGWLEIPNSRQLNVEADALQRAMLVLLHPE